MRVPKKRDMEETFIPLFEMVPGRSDHGPGMRSVLEILYFREKLRVKSLLKYNYVSLL